MQIIFRSFHFIEFCINVPENNNHKTTTRKNQPLPTPPPSSPSSSSSEPPPYNHPLSVLCMSALMAFLQIVFKYIKKSSLKRIMTKCAAERRQSSVCVWYLENNQNNKFKRKQQQQNILKKEQINWLLKSIAK